MRTLFNRIILLSTGLFSVAFAQFHMPGYEEYVLANGLTVYLMEQHEVPLIYISAIFPAGAVNCGDKHGLAALTAECMTFGTENYTKEQIEETVDFIGAELNVSASLEYSALNSYFLKDNQDEMLPVIKDVITCPVFPEDEFEKRKQRWIVELDQAKERPRTVIRDYFKKFIYGDSPYGNPVGGTTESISKIKPDDLKDFYRTNYIPGKSAIAVAGDFSLPQMKQKISELFGNWNPEMPVSVTDTGTEISGPDKSRILLVNKDDSREVTFCIGQLGITRNDPDFINVLVINTIFGGRFTSWLNSALRINSGLTYGAGSYFSPYKNSGTFIISSFTETESAITAINMALNVLDSLHLNGIDEETLTSAKNYIKGQFPPDYETSGDLASLLTQMFFYNIDDSFINNFSRSVDELTTDKAKEIIDKHFPKEKLQFVLIGKSSEIRDKVGSYGELYEKDIKSAGF